MPRPPAACREIEELSALDQRQNARKDLAFPARAQVAAIRAAPSSTRPGSRERNQVAAGIAARPRTRALREHESEVHEERRQHEHCHHVAPVEDPIEAIQPAAEREREHPEKGDAQPKEVQRRLMLGRRSRTDAPTSREKMPTAGHDEVLTSRAGRNRRDRHEDHLLRLQPDDRVVEAVSRMCSVEQVHDIDPPLRRTSVGGNQQIADADAGLGRRGDPARLGRAMTPSAWSRQSTPSSSSDHVARTAVRHRETGATRRWRPAPSGAASRLAAARVRIVD